jgi:hypothetical protein
MTMDGGYVEHLVIILVHPLQVLHMHSESIPQGTYWTYATVMSVA